MRDKIYRVAAFGLDYEKMESVMGEGSTELLFDKAYSIVYGTLAEAV
jgi:hypothetical protein